MKHFIRNIFFYANIIIGLALLISYLAIHLNPKEYILPAFFGLAFPYILIANILFIVYWIALNNFRFILSLLIIVLGWSHLSGFFQFNLPEKKSNKKYELKIISYNVRLFDLYNWSDNKKTRDNMFNFLVEQNADLLCFQEFYHDETNYFSTLDTIIKFQNAKHVHTAYTFTVQNKYHFGIATFSKYPIVKRGKIEFQGTNNICIYTDIKVNEDTIRIYNNHLESIHLQHENYNFIDSITYKSEEERIKGVKDILFRLKKAYYKRSGQVDIISKHIQKSPYEVIVCGDFNDTPVSYAYGKMSMGLKDAFRESGFGLGLTYNRKFFFLRIDYILHSNKIETRNFKTIRNKYSDHFPVVGVFDISELTD